MSITQYELLALAEPGDLIGFSGGGFVGHTIRAAAKLSNPMVPYGKTWSHVGMVYSALEELPTLLESTTKNTALDMATGEVRSGVSLVFIKERLGATPKIRFWYRKLIRPLRAEQVHRLAYLYRMRFMGQSYENLASPGGLWNLIDAELFDWIHIGDESQEDRRLFCSELVSLLAQDLFPGRTQGVTPSQTSPTDLSIGFNTIWADSVEVK